MITHVGNDGRIIISRLIRAAATLMLAAVFGAVLLRIAPGSDFDEQQLDSRLSSATVETMRKQRASQRNLVSFTFEFFKGLARGDAGTSDVFGRPVTELIAERIGTTARSVTTGLFVGWLLAILVAAATAPKTRILSSLGAVALSGTLLSVPSSVLAILCLLLGLSPSMVIAAVVFPRVFPYAHAQLRQSLGAHHVIMARARGISGVRLFWWQVLPGALGPLLALAGVSVAIAFGASIPIEVVADSPGVGQLAWRAALGRDMPLLVTMTLVIAAITIVANAVSDLALARVRVRTG